MFRSWFFPAAPFYSKSIQPGHHLRMTCPVCLGSFGPSQPRRPPSLWWPRRFEEGCWPAFGRQSLSGATWCPLCDWTGLCVRDLTREVALVQWRQSFPFATSAQLEVVRWLSIWVHLSLTATAGFFFPGAEWRGFSYHRDCKSCEQAFVVMAVIQGWLVPGVSGKIKNCAQELNIYCEISLLTARKIEKNLEVLPNLQIPTNL